MKNTFDLIHLPVYQRGSLFGANLVASEFDDSQIVIWGPRGCSSQLFDAQYNQRQECHFRHYLVSEAELLTDGLSALKRDLLPHIATYGVKGPLFLFLGDAPQLTSESIEEFIENNVSPNFPIVYVETGFKGSCKDGINESIYKVIKRFCKQKKTTRSNLINLIPEVGTSPQWKGNAEEISRLLNKIGFEVNIISYKSEVRDVENLAEASYTLLLNPEIGKKAAGYLQDKFNIPVIETQNMPIGIAGTERWLKEIIDFTNFDVPEIDSIIEQETIDYFVKMKPGLREENYNLKVNIIRTSKFLICDDLHRAKQWGKLLISELSFQGGYIFSTTGITESNSQMPEGVELIDDTASLISICKEANIALIFASDWLDELLQQKVDNLIYISGPTIKRITFFSKPYYGFQGSLYFLEDVLNGIDY